MPVTTGRGIFLFSNVPIAVRAAKVASFGGQYEIEIFRAKMPEPFRLRDHRHLKMACGVHAARMPRVDQ